MKFPRIYTDEKGETHIGVRELPEHEASLGPPPNPVGRMTDREAVTSFVTFSVPAGTEAPPAAAPAASAVPIGTVVQTLPAGCICRCQRCELFRLRGVFFTRQLFRGTIWCTSS